jgi:hypothetical protein
MKKISFMFFIAIIIAMVGCEKIPQPEFINNPETPHQDGRGILTININPDGALKSTSSAGDTVKVESNKMFIFSYTSTIPMVSQTWEFFDGSLSNEAIASYYYWGFNQKPVSLVTQDGDGNTYEISVMLDLYARYPGDPVIWLGSELVGSDKYKVSFAVYKNGITQETGPYRLFGSVTPDPWEDYIDTSPDDTNYRYNPQNHQLLPAISGDVGRWIKVVTHSVLPGDHTMTVLKTVGLEDIWGNFKGSEYVSDDDHSSILFNLSADGTVSSATGASQLPGAGGDTGSNAVIRIDIIDDDVIVYFNNNQHYSSINSWTRYLLPDQDWSNPLLLDAVPGFIFWAKYEDNIDNFPLAMEFGPQINQLDNLSENIEQSMFWDNFYNYLYINPLVIDYSISSSAVAGEKIEKRKIIIK